VGGGGGGKRELHYGKGDDSSPRKRHGAKRLERKVGSRTRGKLAQRDRSLTNCKRVYGSNDDMPTGWIKANAGRRVRGGRERPRWGFSRTEVDHRERNSNKQGKKEFKEAQGL